MYISGAFAFKFMDGYVWLCVFPFLHVFPFLRVCEFSITVFLSTFAHFYVYLSFCLYLLIFVCFRFPSFFFLFLCMFVCNCGFRSRLCFFSWFYRLPLPRKYGTTTWVTCSVGGGRGVGKITTKILQDTTGRDKQKVGSGGVEWVK